MSAGLVQIGGRRFPAAPLVALDTLWFQVAGTICNLECTHCFVSCSPVNRSHEMLSLATVRRYLEEAAALGVRDYYFTGGEPFMNRELLAILEAALAYGAATVLTNGVLCDAGVSASLAALAARSEYSLDVRVSIDGWDAATNDPIRGPGTFDRIVGGIRALARAGVDPVITVTEACEGAGSDAARGRFLALLRDAGLTRPRLKILPLLRIGAEVTRARGYRSFEALEERALTREEAATLQCSSSRMVTSKGVFCCPILIEEPHARVGGTLADSLGSVPLSSPACYTCWETGFSCRT